MQKQTVEEITSKLNQLCQNIKDGNSDYLAYSDAINVANTYYRSFNRNMNQGVLGAIKKASDASYDQRISKIELKNILNNAQDSYNNKESNSTTPNTQFNTSNNVRTEYKDVAPERRSYHEPQIIRSSLNNRAIPSNNYTNATYMDGSRNNIYQNNITTVGNDFKTINQSRDVINHGSGISVVRSTNYTKSLVNNNYNPQSTQNNSTTNKNWEYRVVDESHIQRAQLYPKLSENNQSTNYVSQSNNNYTSNPLNNQPPKRMTDNGNQGQIYQQNGNSYSNNSYPSKVQNTQGLSNNGNLSNGNSKILSSINNEDYSSELKAFALKYDDVKVQENSGLRNGSENKTGNQSDVRYR